jgi:hypothetical protein
LPLLTCLVYGVDSNAISVANEIRWEREAQSVARNPRVATTNAGWAATVDIKGNTANAKFQGEFGAEVPVVLAMARLGHFLSVIIVI